MRQSNTSAAGNQAGPARRVIVRPRSTRRRISRPGPTGKMPCARIEPDIETATVDHRDEIRVAVLVDIEGKEGRDATGTGEADGVGVSVEVQIDYGRVIALRNRRIQFTIAVEVTCDFRMTTVSPQIRSGGCCRSRESHIGIADLRLPPNRFGACISADAEAHQDGAKCDVARG
jgi:hypothetical protein